MNIETLFFLVCAVCAFYWYMKRQSGQAIPPTATPPEDPTPDHPDSTVLEVPDKADSFLAQVVKAREHSEIEIKHQTQAYKQELEAKFGEDIKVKEELTKFARENGIDSALIALAEEIKHYP